MAQRFLSKVAACCLCVALCGCGSGVHGLGTTTFESSDRNGTALFALLPPNFDSTKSYPWIIWCHGYGQHGNQIVEGDALSQGIANALAANGYVVVASEYRETLCWGNSSCVDDMRSLSDYARANLHVDGQPFLIGYSMGGMVAINAVAHGAIQPRALIGISPALNLAAQYAKSDFTTSIEVAYHFQGAPQFTTGTNGYDPVHSESLQAMTKVPMLFWASYADTVVDRRISSDLFANDIGALGGSVTIRTSTGDHGDPSNFDPATVVAFFNRYR